MMPLRSLYAIHRSRLIDTCLLIYPSVAAAHQVEALEAFESCAASGSASCWPVHCPVTAPEFTQAIEQLGLSLSLSRDTAAVANMAADGAGTIAIDEFITAVWERKCTRLRGVFAAATKNAWRGEAPQSLSVH